MQSCFTKNCSAIMKYLLLFLWGWFFLRIFKKILASHVFAFRYLDFQNSNSDDNFTLCQIFSCLALFIFPYAALKIGWNKSPKADVNRAGICLMQYWWWGGFLHLIHPSLPSAVVYLYSMCWLVLLCHYNITTYTLELIYIAWAHGY